MGKRNEGGERMRLGVREIWGWGMGGRMMVGMGTRETRRRISW